MTAAVREAMAAMARETETVRGGRDGRGGLNIPKPSFDTPMAQKQQNTKASKNAYKKEHDARKDRDEELRGKNAKGGERALRLLQCSSLKKAEAKVEEIKTIVIPETITIKELAEKMKLQPSAIVKKTVLTGDHRDHQPGDRL